MIHCIDTLFNVLFRDDYRDEDCLAELGLTSGWTPAPSDAR